MHKTRVYLAKSNDARSQDVNVIRSYLRLHDVEVVEHNPSTTYSNGPLLSSDYLIIIPAYNCTEDSKPAQRLHGRIWSNSFRISIGKGLTTQISDFDKTKIGLGNVYVYSGRDLQFRKINKVVNYGTGMDWKDYAFIEPSSDVIRLEFLKEKQPDYSAEFMIKLTGSIGQFCEPSYDSYRTIDGAVITYKGNSRIDNAPMFNIKMNTQMGAEKKIRGYLTNWRFAQWAGCVEGTFDFLEAGVAKTRDWTVKQSEGRMEREPIRSAAADIIKVMPMSKPDRTMFYIDYVYEDKNKYRLLLTE